MKTPHWEAQNIIDTVRVLHVTLGFLLGGGGGQER